MTIILRMALRNVIKNWRHSLAAILTISAGLISYVLFSGYMARVAHQYEESYRHRTMFGDLILENKGMITPAAKSDPFKYYLSLAEQTAIEDFLKTYQDKILNQVRFLLISGMASNGKASGIFWGSGHDIQAGANMRGPIWSWNTTYGVPLKNSSATYPIVLGQSLGRNFGCATTGTNYHFNNVEGYPAENRPFSCAQPEVQLSLLTESGQLNAIDFEISGLIDAGYRDLDLRYIHTSLPAAQALLNTNKITYYTIELKNPDDTTEFISAFSQSMGSKFPELKAFRWAEHPVGDIYVTAMELLTIFKVFVVTVILSISFLSIFNTMVKIVRERIREIGTLRSLGYQRGQILGLFAAEAFFLSLLGCSMGSLLALIFSFILNVLKFPYKAGMMSEPTLFQIQYQALDYLYAFLFLGILAIVTALFASREPTQQSVASNLSHV